MKLVTFTTGSAERVGIADPDNGVVRDAAEVLGGADLAAAIGHWDAYRAALADALPSLPAVPLDSVRLRAPLRPVRDIFAVGKNYRDHVREFGRSGYDTPSRSEELPDKPIIFTKATTSVTGPCDDIDPHHGVTRELDYEGELGVIIGPGGRGITAADAFAPTRSAT
jgi:2-keto-4-pentenoate hydratase/2-oxohepta-3-ene-1,7-dioic acid hydratase in catechol pathway